MVVNLNARKHFHSLKRGTGAMRRTGGRRMLGRGAAGYGDRDSDLREISCREQSVFRTPRGTCDNAKMLRTNF